MRVDGYVQQLKGKKVFAMVTAGKSQVDFYYEENNEIQVKPILRAKKCETFKQYAMVCGLLWDVIAIGEGWESCRNFQNGRLFVPIRGPKGVMYVDFKYLGKFSREDGHTYMELQNGMKLECCKNSMGNEERIKEARKIAAVIGIVSGPTQASCAIPPMQDAHPVIADPVVRNGPFEKRESMGVVKKKKPKRRKAPKEGALERDLINALPLGEEIQSGHWKHAEDIDKESFTYQTIKSKKKIELEKISARFYELVALCERDC